MPTHSRKRPQRAAVVVAGHCFDMDRAWGTDKIGWRTNTIISEFLSKNPHLSIVPGPPHSSENNGAEACLSREAKSLRPRVKRICEDHVRISWPRPQRTVGIVEGRGVAP